MAGRVHPRIRRAAVEVGEHLVAWRKLQGLTTTVVAERADISRGTLRKIEHGDPTVSLAAVLRVARSLGALDHLVDALDPYETDLGRHRANEQLPERVRP